MVATPIHSEEPIHEQAVQDQVPINYIKRSMRKTRSPSVLEIEAAKQLDVAAEKCDQQLKVAGKNAETVKKVAAGKKKQSKAKAVGKNKRAKTQLTEDEQAQRDEHAKQLMQLCELADEEISKLKNSIPSEAGPSTSACDPSFLEVPIDDICLFGCPKRNMN
jgi:wobble nucleotide-excising tRNase